MFETFRDIRRIKRENRELTAKVARLEAKLEKRTELLLERDFLMTDQVLTAAGRFGVTDIAKQNVETPTVTDSAVRSEALDAYLADKKDFLRECAAEKYEPEQIEREVEKMFNEQYPTYLSQFEAEYDFLH